MTAKLHKGSHVLIIYKGREVEGRVIMASDNLKSLMLGFDAMLGGFVGMMPVLDNGDGYRDLIENEPVEVKPL
jgi:hypothetical protein